MHLMLLLIHLYYLHTKNIFREFPRETEWLELYAFTAEIWVQPLLSN